MSDFVSFNDFVLIFLELVGIVVLEEMNVKSFVDIFYVEENGRIDDLRNFVVVGCEWYVFVC